MTDAVVVGAGLAGACAALVLSRTRQVVVVEADRPAAGASGAAAGLANPFMGRKATPAWRHDEALDALAEVDAEACGGHVRATGILRPATSAAQAATFEERSTEHADLDWLSAAASAERWPTVRSTRGTLVVGRGGSVDLPAFVEALLAKAVERGATLRSGRVSGWSADAVGVTVHLDGQDSIRTRHLVLAVGDGTRQLAPLAGLPLHRVKGQTIRLARPEVVVPDHPAVAGAGYAVPFLDGVVVGSTFEHTFTHADPDPALDVGLLKKGAALLPALDGAPVTDRRAGVRLTVPATVSPRRLPLAGPLPGAPGVWVISGLGAKGLLTAPLISRRLPDALDGRTSLPHELRPPTPM